MRAEQALRESHNRMETILFSLPTGILIIDSKTNEIIKANPQALIMIGLPSELTEGSKYHQFIYTADVRNPISDFEIACNNSEGILVDADGENIPLSVTLLRLPSSNCDLLCRRCYFLASSLESTGFIPFSPCFLR